MQATLDKPVAIQPAHEEDCACPLCRIYRYPNAGTLEAFAELENGGGTVFHGSTDEFFAMLDALPDEE